MTSLYLPISQAGTQKMSADSSPAPQRSYLDLISDAAAARKEALDIENAIAECEQQHHDLRMKLQRVSLRHSQTMTDIDTFIESQVSGMAGGAPPINLSSRENQALASSSSGLLNQGMINGHLGKFTQANYQDILTIT